jgi:hypothetical protein
MYRREDQTYQYHYGEYNGDGAGLHGDFPLFTILLLIRYIDTKESGFWCGNVTERKMALS